MSIDTPDLQALIELSEKASPGPWEDVGPNEEDERCIYADNDYAVAAIIPCGFPETNESRTKANASFVVALVNWFRSTRAATVPQGDGWIDASKLVLPPRRYTSHAGMVGTTAADEIWNEAIDTCNAAIDAALPPQQGG